MGYQIYKFISFEKDKVTNQEINIETPGRYRIWAIGGGGDGGDGGSKWGAYKGANGGGGGNGAIASIELNLEKCNISVTNNTNTIKVYGVLNETKELWIEVENGKKGQKGGSAAWNISSPKQGVGGKGGIGKKYYETGMIINGQDGLTGGETSPLTTTKYSNQKYTATMSQNGYMNESLPYLSFGSGGGGGYGEGRGTPKAGLGTKGAVIIEKAYTFDNRLFIGDKLIQNIFVGEKPTPIVSINPPKKNIKKVWEVDARATPSVKSIVFDNDGYLYHIFDGNTLAKRVSETGKWVWGKTFPKKEKLLCLETDKDNHIYVCTDSEIVVIDTEGEVVSTFPIRAERLCVDDNKNMYIMKKRNGNVITAYDNRGVELYTRSNYGECVGFALINNEYIFYAEKNNTNGMSIESFLYNSLNGSYITSPIYARNVNSLSNCFANTSVYNKDNIYISFNETFIRTADGINTSRYFSSQISSIANATSSFVDDDGFLYVGKTGGLIVKIGRDMEEVWVNNINKGNVKILEIVVNNGIYLILSNGIVMKVIEV